MRSRHHRQSRRVAQREGQWVQSITCKAEDAGNSAKKLGSWGAFRVAPGLTDRFTNVLAMCVAYGTGPGEVEVEVEVS
jgi:hypothetical protein